jgi:predicted lysophospholipase L1 biosynthesis ABC-type transport system permease subunit
VGIVRDALFTMARAPASEREVFFTSMAQWTPLGLVSFVMRTRAEDPAVALPAVRAALAEVAPRAVLDWTDPVDRAFGDRYVTDRFLVALTGAFALTALALAAVGLFAVLAHLVARTRTEFGVRRALGATRARVVRGVVAGALRTVVIGLAIGLLAALAASRALGSVLYGIGRFDPWSYGSSAAVLLLVAAAAAALPALRAASVHPAESLRSD